MTKQTNPPTVQVRCEHCGAPLFMYLDSEERSICDKCLAKEELKDSEKSWDKFVADFGECPYCGAKDVHPGQEHCC